MNPNLTEIVFILDRSGSMAPLKQSTIDGYNKFLKEQKQQPGDALITTVLFNQSYRLIHNRTPIQQVSDLTTEDYIPAGMTALYDTVGFMIDSIGEKLAQEAEANRPGAVIFVIITDGEENASREYSGSTVKEMIEHQQSVYSWNFIFLGAGIDAYRMSSAIGISSQNTASYAASLDGMNNIYTSMSNAVCSVRSNGSIDCSWKEQGEINISHF